MFNLGENNNGFGIGDYIINIGKDGLYLSDSHYKNPSFDENKLRFRRFKLVHYNKK
ncbi:hypothetical protein AC094_37740 [Bacteroides fragilis]|uniref:Uncharacterized protein n=2 Tax=Bacteroides fragilis TaxID=817 RepID=A0A016E3S7_BACFG|nr:hypothetical protein M123_3840 [Bacteroides fragilis str. 3976T8]EYA37713.1 hypothetical protein M075_3886 [Bacteroides fragilis str. 20793-3]OCR28510.1 hypothetical protein AC094_37740 [Bacteroides fragilis]